LEILAFGIGFLAGVLACVLLAGVLLYRRVRRVVGSLPLRAQLASLTPTRPASSVETDAEGFILPQEDTP
jgi:hypothetical protein